MAKKKKEVKRKTDQVDGSETANPLAHGANVRDYFLMVLGRPDTDGDREAFKALTDFPCESECGAECVMAINAARTLLDHVERATGTDYPERNDAVLEVAFHVCMTYAFG